MTAQANLVGPGAVRHAGAGLTYVAMLPGRTALIEASVTLLNQAGIETQATSSADSLIWGKLAANAGINPLTALFDIPNGDLLTEPKRRHFMVAAAREAGAVAAALNIRLPYPDVAAQVEHVAHVTGENISSMLQDVRRQVPTEIDAICGAVVRHGSHLNVPTPVNAALLNLIRDKESGRPMSPEEIDRVLSQVA